jgi:DNA-directed RNA polymerase subunit RPC12/RpoP
MPRPHRLVMHAGIAVAMALVLAYPVSAGTSYKLKCSNCDFDAFMVMTSAGLDGRLGQQTVAIGYCCKCEKMVSVGYTAKTPEDERKKLETPVGEVFSFDNGVRYTLYACPECGKPFIALKTARPGLGAKTDKLFCPKCGEQTLEGSGGRIME